MNKNLVIVGLIVAVVGIIFAFLPAEVHMSLFGSGESMGEMGHHNHGAFMSYGLIASVIGLAIAFTGWKIWD